MNFKVFSIVCGVILAMVLSTQKSRAIDPDPKIGFGACVGSDDHVCKEVEGTKYYGYWVEGSINF